MRLAILRIIDVTLKFHRKQLSPVFAHKDFKVCEVYIAYFLPHLRYYIPVCLLFLLYFYIQPQNLSQSCTKDLATGRKYKFAWFSHFCSLGCYVVFHPQWMCLTWESTTESYALGVVSCRPFSICAEENSHSFLITHCPKFSTFVVGCL